MRKMTNNANPLTIEREGNLPHDELLKIRLKKPGCGCSSPANYKLPTKKSR